MKPKALLGGLALWASLLIFMFSIPFWSLSSEQEVSFDFLNTLKQDKAIVFFGFSNCGDVCPASMSVLKLLLSSQRAGLQIPAVVFVDIDQNSTPDKAKAYAKGFDEAFVGVHPDKQTLDLMKSQFGLNIRQSGNSIQHQGRTYILERRSQSWVLTSTIDPRALNTKRLRKELLI